MLFIYLLLIFGPDVADTSGFLLGNDEWLKWRFFTFRRFWRHPALHGNSRTVCVCFIIQLILCVFITYIVHIYNK